MANGDLCGDMDDADPQWRGQGRRPGPGAGKHRAAGPWSQSISGGGEAGLPLTPAETSSEGPDPLIS